MRAIVIDDSRAIRMILRRIVGQAGFEVLEAGDGKQAMDILAGLDGAPELALIDWNMPEMNGLEFVVEVRKRPEWRNITLVM